MTGKPGVSTSAPNIPLVTRCRKATSRRPEDGQCVGRGVHDAFDPQRCAEAGVPDDIEFLTKPALAAGMLRRTLRAGVPARWAAADEKAE